MTPEQKKLSPSDFITVMSKTIDEKFGPGEPGRFSTEEVEWLMQEYAKQPTLSPDVEAMAEEVLKKNCDGVPDWTSGFRRDVKDAMVEMYQLGQASQPQDAAQDVYEKVKSIASETPSKWIENAKKRREDVAQVQEELYDLSDIPEVEKDKLVKGFVEVAAHNALKLFLSLGLKTHIESMVVNDATGEEYILSFRTVENWKTTREMESQLSAAHEEIKRLRAQLDVFGTPVTKNKGGKP